MAFFCHRCGTGLPGGARFCSNCGTVISPGPPTAGRPLLRPHVGRQIAGVCLGLAQGQRLGCGAGAHSHGGVFLLFRRGLVAVAYIAGWVGIPEESDTVPGAYPPKV